MVPRQARIVRGKKRSEHLQERSVELAAAVAGRRSYSARVS